ncbi:hypothetical protein RSAG8_07350, partial [Rhizoctonia solani AG-8 WAC10335]
MSVATPSRRCSFFNTRTPVRSHVSLFTGAWTRRLAKVTVKKRSRNAARHQRGINDILAKRNQSAAETEKVCAKASANPEAETKKHAGNKARCRSNKWRTSEDSLYLVSYAPCDCFLYP